MVCYEARADNVFVGFSNFSIEKLSEFIISECKSEEKYELVQQMIRNLKLEGVFLHLVHSSGIELIQANFEDDAFVNILLYILLKSDSSIPQSIREKCTSIINALVRINSRMMRSNTFFTYTIIFL